MKTSLFSRDALAESTPGRAQPVRGASRLAAVARAAATATLMLTAATQLSGCFPVIAGAMGAGVMSATDRRPTSIQAVDRGLQLEIENTLATRYSGAARVNVTVFNKKVLLTGEVKDTNLRQQIEQYVRGLPNAREVINELEVVSSPSFAAQSQDAFVTSKVKTMLMTAEGVPSNSTKVTTERGVVYLMGLVTRPEGDRATETARNVGGVSKVVKVFDYIDETERARLDAAASSQNAAPGEPVGGTPAPVQTTPGTAAPANSAPAPVGADLSSPVTAPTTSPVPGPVGLPPGRNLP
ncbi:BON domain-containing protein [Cupriavidus sp. UGS-1]|uniref:BON domain-containing protein n=1 Tax=Cupriavidus sp. UGS-1 TaxID=2899826 RepID=UPI00351D1B1B